jgi:DnaJ family protein C protein 8
MQAESELSDKPKRDELDAVINEARGQLLKTLNLPTLTADSDPRLHDLDPPFKVRLRAQSKQLLIDEELLRRKLVYLHFHRHRVSIFESPEP